MKLGSYWIDTAPAFVGAAATPAEGKYDVAIVGGGFTGLSAALTLATNGISAIVLEAGQVGGEASGRNGGHCNNGLSHDFATIRDRFGIERAREMYRSFDAGVDLVEAIARDHKIDCDFVRSGKLKLAAKATHFASLVRNQELLAQEVDADTAILPSQDLAVEIGSTQFHGGLLQKRSASLNVGRFVVGLARAASSAGARIHERTPVSAIEAMGASRFRVSTGNTSVIIDNVILATGTSRQGPFAWLRRRIVPIGSFIIVTEPLDPAIAHSIMPGRRNCTTSQHIGFYFRMTADNRLVFGGRARFAMSNPQSVRQSGAVLESHMRAIFPQLASVGVDYCWGALVDMTADRLPRSGVRDGLHYAMGFSGHGVQMSTLMGNIMARQIAGEDAPNPWRDIDWPAIPGHFGTPWFLPAVGAYYRVMDRLH